MKQAEFEREFRAYNKFLRQMRSRQLSRAEFEEHLKRKRTHNNPPRQKYVSPKPRNYRESAADSIPSHGPSLTSNNICARKSVMDPHWQRQQNESAETIQAIKDKSKRLRPAYNKGAYQYLPDKD